jgi:hypothetical protein
LRPGRPSAGLVVAIIALIVALGGTSYAAFNLPKNSVGTRQLKNNSVTGAKIKAHAVSSAQVRTGSLLAADFKGGQLPAGPKGDRGPMGPSGPSGPPGTSAGPPQAWQLVSDSSNAGDCPSVTGQFCGSPCGSTTTNCPWANYGAGYATAAYYKDPWGVVHLRGLVGSGSDGGVGTFGFHATYVFFLPVGYRPPATEQFAVPVQDTLTFPSGSIGRVDVSADGGVRLVYPGTAGIDSLALDSISFRAS